MNAVVTASKARVSWSHNIVWLIKRELWEHRALYIAPLVIAAVTVVAALWAAFQAGHGQMVHTHFDVSEGNIPSGQLMKLSLIFAAPFAFITAVVIVYYTLDALYADRRDRSVLFWKSLPVSDVETVAAKLAVASLIAPTIAIAVAIATQFIVLVIVSVGMAAHGHAWLRIWTEIPFFDNLLLVLYALVVQALWYLPIWAWFLLASSWARRTVFLWATVPIGVLWMFEYQTLGTQHVGELLRTRVAGAFPLAMSLPDRFMEDSDPARGIVMHVTDIITPGVIFSSPQLWGGLVVAGALIAATVWVRRYREAA